MTPCVGCADTAAEVERLRAERARVVALADEWERKHCDHITAATRAAGPEVVALQVAAGSVRKLCAADLLAALDRERPGVRVMTSEIERLRAELARVEALCRLREQQHVADDDGFPVVRTSDVLAMLARPWYPWRPAIVAEAVCKCGHGAWVDHGGVMAPPAGCDYCDCPLDEHRAADCAIEDAKRGVS